MLQNLDPKSLDHRLNIVTEICVPEQWRAYQQYVAKISGLYYLDPPIAYLNLAKKKPPLMVKPFGDFYFDAWPGCGLS